MSFLIHVIPCIYYYWENTKVNEIISLLTKKILRNLCICDLTLRNCHQCTNCMPKRPVTGNEVCDYHMSNYGMCRHMCLHAIHDQACILVNIHTYLHHFIAIFTQFQFSLIHKQIFIKIS